MPPPTAPSQVSLILCAQGLRNELETLLIRCQNGIRKSDAPMQESAGRTRQEMALEEVLSNIQESRDIVREISTLLENEVWNKL